MIKNKTKQKSHKIRSSLISDREHQDGYKRNAQKQAFGRYRPLTEESSAKITDVLYDAKKDVDQHLQKVRGTAPIAKLIMREEFGVTFLMRGKVSKAMRFGLLQRGFAIDRMIEGVEQHNQDKDASLDVPIETFGWYGENRTMVSRLGYSDGLQELLDEVPQIEEMLRLSKASGLEVAEPNHVSLFKYGRSGDNKDLSMRQRWEVSGIMREHFEAANIGSLAFGALVMGDSYTQPKLVG